MSVPSARLSEHFTPAEMLESQTARRYPALWAQQCHPSVGVLANLEDLANEVLEPLRAVFDWPIKVTSGYRCRDLNARIPGSSDRSQHCVGLAADIGLVSGFLHAPETEEARRRLRSEWLKTVQVDPPLDMPRNGWLWMAAALMVRDELPIHQLIHEQGEPWAPAWIHVGMRRDPRRRLTAIGGWTGGEYQHYESVSAIAQDMAAAT